MLRLLGNPKLEAVLLKKAAENVRRKSQMLPGYETLLEAQEKNVSHLTLLERARFHILQRQFNGSSTFLLPQLVSVARLARRLWLWPRQPRG